MSEPNGNGLRRYMPLWLFLAAQFVVFVIWCAKLQTEVANMHEVGGVPISTEARELLATVEQRLREHERRLDTLERK